MPTTIEAETGIFEYLEPQTVSKEAWAREHLDCDAIIDDNGSTIVVYAFTLNPQFNYALERFKKKTAKYINQFILGGISSDGLNSLI